MKGNSALPLGSQNSTRHGQFPSSAYIWIYMPWFNPVIYFHCITIQHDRHVLVLAPRLVQKSSCQLHALPGPVHQFDSLALDFYQMSGLRFITLLNVGDLRQVTTCVTISSFAALFCTSTPTFTETLQSQHCFSFWSLADDMVCAKRGLKVLTWRNFRSKLECVLVED